MGSLDGNYWEKLGPFTANWVIQQAPWSLFERQLKLCRHIISAKRGIALLERAVSGHKAMSCLALLSRPHNRPCLTFESDSCIHSLAKKLKHAPLDKVLISKV